MKLIPFLFTLILAFGCGPKKWAIENADLLLGHQITKRVPLYSAQKKELDKDIDQLLNATKPSAQELLPIFDELKLHETENVKSHFTKLEKFYHETAIHFSNIMSRYIARLDKKQRKDFFETLDDENRQIQKKGSSDQLDRIEDRIAHFIGPLTPRQKQILADHSGYFAERTKSRLTDRKILHQDFREIFEEKTSESSKEERLKNAFKHYLDKRRSNQKMLEIVEQFIPTMKTSQHEKLREKAQEIKELLKFYLEVDY